jgi:7-carboxy-7-deazaguanine synthase
MTAVESHSQRLLPLVGKPPGMLLIHEIYRSLQGESTFAGLPCVFVRLTVCEARCAWCDTPHAFTQGQLHSLDEVIIRVKSFNTPLVEVTGGEPLLQDEVYPLMTRLADLGLTVLLETSGLHRVDRVDPRVHIIMDLKCPGSGESANNCWENLNLLKPSDQIKCVVASEEDFRWAAEIVQSHELDQRFTVLFSAVFGAVTLPDLARWVLESGLQARMQLQLHKYIWDPKARGV